MTPTMGMQRIQGMGGGCLPQPRLRRKLLPVRLNRISRQHATPPSARLPSTLKPLGLGSGRLPQRKRITCPIRCIAQPLPSNGVQAIKNRLTSVIPQPRSILNTVAEKLGVSSGEWKTFLPMTFLFFTMAFVNTIVSNLSMSLVITAPGGGAGVLPFLTVYAAFPLTLGATFLYAYASHYISHRKLFTFTVGLFAAFNLVFAMCLFPNHEALHLPGVADALAKFLPSGLNGAVGMVRNWTFSIFYCLSEMWGDMGISLLFWGFANDITTSKQAPILYPLMGIGANVAQTLGGIAVKLFSVGSAAAYGSRFQALLFQIVGCMVVVMGVHHFIANRTEQKAKEAQSLTQTNSSESTSPRENNILPAGTALHAEEKCSQNDNHPIGVEASQTDSESGRVRGGLSRTAMPLHRNLPNPVFVRSGNTLHASFRPLPVQKLSELPLINVYDASVLQSGSKAGRKKVKKTVTKQTKGEEEKKNPSFMESIRTLKNSPVVQSLGWMTIAQALSVTLMEFVWKSHVKLACPTPAAFSAFMGDIATVVGLVTGSMMFLSPILFNKIGWNGVASITPVLMTIGGCAFFASCSAFHIFGQLGMTQIAQKLLPITVMGGAFLFVLSRGTKFSLFKPSEEMVYIKMDESQRTKGKAAVDVVGANIGKSGGSALQQVLLLASGGHLLFITPVMFAVYMSMMKFWNGAVKTLAGFQEEQTVSTEASEEKPNDTVSSFPLQDADEGDDEILPHMQSTMQRDDDLESVGSSVVEFPHHTDLDDYPISSDKVHSHPVMV